jgi:hypothetical protein
MTTLHFTKTTTATPQQFLVALTDFGPGRSEVFPNSKDELETVRELGPDHADVTEGSKSSWERLSYDWSDPDRVVMSTTDSNLWGGHSGHTYTFTPRPDGTTRLDVVVVREGKKLQGQVPRRNVPPGRPEGPGERSRPHGQGRRGAADQAAGEDRVTYMGPGATSRARRARVICARLSASPFVSIVTGRESCATPPSDYREW